MCKKKKRRSVFLASFIINFVATLAFYTIFYRTKINNNNNKKRAASR